MGHLPQRKIEPPGAPGLGFYIFIKNIEIFKNDDILEIWEGIAFFSLDFPNPNTEFSSIKNHINNLYSNLDDIKKKL